MIKNFQQTSLDDLTLDLFKQVVSIVQLSKHESFAPLGCSGKTFILHTLAEQRSWDRVSAVSLRKHNGNVELLITNKEGVFLFYGKYDASILGINTVAEEYYRIFLLCKSKILGSAEASDISDEDKELMRKNYELFRNMAFIGF